MPCPYMATSTTRRQTMHCPHGTRPRPKQAALPDQAQQRGTARSSDVTKWWADGDEPLYYIVSSKARLNLALPHKHAPVSSCMQALLQGCPVDVLCSLL